MQRRSLVWAALAAVLLASCTVALALPMSLSRPLADARVSSSSSGASDDSFGSDVVALQMADTVHQITESAKAAGHAVPHIIPLNVRARSEQEEEEYFALIDEHHDNLEQGQTERRTTDIGNCTSSRARATDARTSGWSGACC